MRWFEVKDDAQIALVTVEKITENFGVSKRAAQKWLDEHNPDLSELNPDQDTDEWHDMFMQFVDQFKSQVDAKNGGE
jgi:hypothetical protein